MTDPKTSRRSRLILLPLAGVLVLAALWSGFWVYAASAAKAAIADWRQQEERRGRTYSCGTQTFGGFPFRIEVRCLEAGAELRTAQPPLTIKAHDIVVVAQVYAPTLLIAEITGPLTVAETGRPMTLIANWTLAQASARGMPGAPERVSVVIDGLRLDRPLVGGDETLFGAGRVELHGRPSPAWTAASPALDIAARLVGATAPGAGAIAAVPLDAEVTAVLHGLAKLTLDPLRIQLKELQAANGSLEVTRARVQQADTVAQATGVLAVSPRGRLDGTLRVTVVGIDKVLARSGLDKAVASASSDRTPSLGTLRSLAPVQGVLDRLVPGLGTAVRDNPGGTLAAGLALIGERTELEGKPALALPLRFSDGAAFIGPIPLGQVTPFY